MIEFMVIAAPRSGTTWASNWLTTDKTLCLHDPLWNYHYTEIDSIKTQKMLGVSCTGLFMFHDWVNRHPARKVILHRDLNEINESLAQIGLGAISAQTYANLEKIDGVHLQWNEIFTNPKPIYEYLLQMPFDEERHALLKRIEMQPDFEKLEINKGVTEKLLHELSQLDR